VLENRIADTLPTLSADAAEGDRCNRIVENNYRMLQANGVAAAFVPRELGGLGLESMHDWIVAINRLARGDGSTAIALSMHLSATRGMAARWRTVDQSSAQGRRLTNALAKVASGEILVCSTTTESGHDNLHPHTEATRLSDGGWRIDGRKYFVTMSPVASHINLNLRMRDQDGDYIANVLAPLGAPGILPQDDWDALGMRASGSQSIVFDDCRIPEEALRIVGPWGRWSIPVLLHRTLANVPLVAAFLGIAEVAHAMAVEAMSKPAQAARSGVQHTVAEMEIGLTTCRCMMSQIGHRLDEVVANADNLTMESGHRLMKDYQSVKWVVNRTAIDIVSKAMDLAGGRGYVSANSLTRLYRDVRAGPFMQPHSPVDAREYIGQVVLSRYPDN